jgi:hypothetical protein
MSGKSDYTAESILNWVTGRTAMPSLPTPYLALFTAAPTSDAGTGGTEVSGGSYARIVASGSGIWGAAGASSGTEPSVTPAAITNSAGGITFATSTGSWGSVLAWGLYDAVTAGNLLWWDYLGNFPWLPCTVSAASPGIITAHAHGYSANDPVAFTTKFGGTIPTFSASNFTNNAGTLLVVSPATDSFSTTNAAAAVNTSSTGNGAIRKLLVQAIASGITVTFNTSTFTLSDA